MIRDNLKGLRKLKGYTQENLAEKLDVSRQAVAKWERGESVPDLNNLIAMTQLFDVTLDDLVNYEPDQSGLGVPPKGKHMLGAVVLDEKRRLQIPEKAMTLFNWEIGDEILVLGDENEGIALIKKDEFLSRIQDLYRTAKDV